MTSRASIGTVLLQECVHDLLIGGCVLDLILHHYYFFNSVRHLRSSALMVGAHLNTTENTLDKVLWKKMRHFYNLSL